jgi:LytS/YehU family sensor histidine kinase
MEKNTKLNGTWENGFFRLIIKGDRYNIINLRKGVNELHEYLQIKI